MLNFKIKFARLAAAILSLFSLKPTRQFKTPNFNRQVALFQHFSFARAFRNNTQAVGLVGIAIAIIGLVIGLTVMASLLPDAIVDISNETSYTGAPASVITIFTVIVPIVVGAAVVLLIFKEVT